MMGWRGTTALAVFILSLAPMMTGAVHGQDLRDGKAEYDRYCAPCHDKGFWAANRIGQRLGEEHADIRYRDDLNVPYVETVVRRGMGSMPPYRLTELSPEELQAIADYLTREAR